MVGTFAQNLAVQGGHPLILRVLAGEATRLTAFAERGFQELDVVLGQALAAVDFLLELERLRHRDAHHPAPACRR
jgi:hypothetical protein